jgi:hypothetical protein
MPFLNLDEVCITRWTYMLFILVSALSFLAFVLMFPTAPPIAGSICLILFAGVWSAMLKARLIAVGLPHSRWVLLLCALLVYVACVLLFYLFSKGRFFVPGLFVILNMPLVILKEKSSDSDASILT